MSKLSNLLNMYILIESRNLIKIKELSEILEVSERTVKGYKNDLEKAGIYVGSKRGRYGGYYLENKLRLDGLEISSSEILSGNLANEIIQGGDYIFAREFEKLIAKLNNYKDSFQMVNLISKENLRPKILKEIEEVNWGLINKAIIKNKKIEIEYISNNYKQDSKNISVRTIHPYGLFDYDMGMYVYGYCELRDDIRYFKLARIESIKILDKKFKINKKYNLKKELKKSFGIMDDEEFYLKLEITYPMSKIIKEKQYILNQKITDINENTILYEANVKGYQEVKTWVKSMGSSVKVILPKNLKEDIIKDIQKVKEIYNGT